MAVRGIFDHSILIKFSISFQLFVRDKVGIGLMKIHFVCWLCSGYPWFWSKCCWHLEPSKPSFRRVEISQPHIYPKNLSFLPVTHTLYYFRNMVEKFKLSRFVETTESQPGRCQHGWYKTQVLGPRSQVPGPRAQVPSPKSQVPPRSQVPGPRS